MTLRILHTSDWHLGHTLHDVSREDEHDAFLSWLLDTLHREKSDALLIAGDVFDTANPPATAQRRWYKFLSQARNRLPSLDIVAIAGNHDSCGRLEAPQALLEEFDIQVVGKLARSSVGELDFDKCLFPLCDASGEIAAWCAAVPFLRPSDLPRATDTVESNSEGVRAVYRAILEAASQRCTAQQAIIAMGHCYMVSTTVSELSERKIMGGNEFALPADIFDDTASYVALGHLHLGQSVAGQSRIRYSGSPIPLAMDEMRYKHHVCLVVFEGKKLVEVTEVPVPRAIGMLRIPSDGPQPWNEVERSLARLPRESNTENNNEPKPYLEVRVRLDAPDSMLRRRVAEAIKGKHARLVKITLEYTGSGKSLSQQLPDKHLHDLTAEDVLLQLYQSRHDGHPSEDMMMCFRELVAEVGLEDA